MNKYYCVVCDHGFPFPSAYERHLKTERHKSRVCPINTKASNMPPNTLQNKLDDDNQSSIDGKHLCRLEFFIKYFDTGTIENIIESPEGKKKLTIHLH